MMMQEHSTRGKTHMIIYSLWAIVQIKHWATFGSLWEPIAIFKNTVR